MKLKINILENKKQISSTFNLKVNDIVFSNLTYNQLLSGYYVNITDTNLKVNLSNGKCDLTKKIEIKPKLLCDEFKIKSFKYIKNCDFTIKTYKHILCSDFTLKVIKEVSCEDFTLKSFKN